MITVIIAFIVKCDSSKKTLMSKSHKNKPVATYRMSEIHAIPFLAKQGPYWSIIFCLKIEGKLSLSLICKDSVDQ